MRREGFALKKREKGGETSIACEKGQGEIQEPTGAFWEFQFTSKGGGGE